MFFRTLYGEGNIVEAILSAHIKQPKDMGCFFSAHTYPLASIASVKGISDSFYLTNCIYVCYVVFDNLLNV